MENNIKQVQVKMNVHLHSALKSLAGMQGVTLNSYICGALLRQAEADHSHNKAFLETMTKALSDDDGQ